MSEAETGAEVVSLIVEKFEPYPDLSVYFAMET